MYRKHWGLRELPFGPGIDPKAFFPGPSHEEALARLQFLVDENRRVGLLMGGGGSGKTLLFSVLAQQLRLNGRQVANLSLLGCEDREFLWSLSAALCLNPPRGAQTFALWRGLTDRIAENRYQRCGTVLLLDDADEATGEVLSHVVRLAQSDPSPAARLTVLLAASNERVECLGPRLLELAELRIDIEPWEEADTSAFVTSALIRAGRAIPVFDEVALARLHELSSGNPRRVGQLANLALLAGAGRQLDRIDADTIDAVCQELGAAELSPVRE
jgi:type II secretory pathway predicted ATPase ExeA